jgi:glycosyltransferase involved in cell wall biosynthesis
MTHKNSEVMTNSPMVDVAIVTYNHEKYIAQAIESVLMQKTDFKVRMIIGDDCSSDKTQEIIKEFSQKYPDYIKTILYDKHIGIFSKDRVGIKVLEQCTAKHIALLDGDDYWTDPNKLQKQVNFLESHPDCALCFHNVHYEDSIGEFQGFTTFASRCKRLQDDTDATFTIRDTLMGGLIPTCSVLLRNEPAISNLPEFFFQTRTGDWLLWLLVCKDKTMRYFHRPMAVYRINSAGLSFELRRNMDALYYDRVQMLIELDQYWGFQLHDLLTPAIRHYAKLTPIDFWSSQVLARFARYSI